MFEGRELLIATMHGKESVIAPIMEEELIVTCKLNPLFNTDAFGTFSGETERQNDPFTTARNKCPGQWMQMIRICALQVKDHLAHTRFECSVQLTMSCSCLLIGKMISKFL